MRLASMDIRLLALPSLTVIGFECVRSIIGKGRLSKGAMNSATTLPVAVDDSKGTTGGMVDIEV
jgi:hypothetical protein